MGKLTLTGRLTLTAVWLCFGLLMNVYSQNATVSGTVNDSTGALLPSVEVTARNVAIGITNTTLTNETGTYNFPSLQTGTYEISAQLLGFQTSRYTDVVLGGGQQVRLNFTLPVADVATAVEVTAQVDTALVTTSASIQTVLPEAQVRELPLGDRNVMELLTGMAGTGPTEGTNDGNFAGGRLNAVNVTLDGVTVSGGRYDQGVLGVAYMSPDLVEEVRVTTGTVDAEARRGSGQIQMVTRSGTNEFRGSAFWYNRNSALQAANWFNNFNNRQGDYENRNQYGFRLSGPIIRDKTFFFFLIDNQRTAVREDFVGTVLTNEARQGIFRFFPGADNRNALDNRPTVDLNGNPIRPAGASGDLQSINLFTLDPYRRGYDTSGWVQNTFLGRMPQPNDWTVGDGLNTAGFRFVRRVYGIDTHTEEVVDRNNRDQFNARLDHYFSPTNKFSFIYTFENSRNQTPQSGLGAWGQTHLQGENSKFPRFYNASLVSTLSANVVNEFRVGFRGHDVGSWEPWYVGRDRGDDSTISERGLEAHALLPRSNDIPFNAVPTTITEGFMKFTASYGSTRGSWSPMLSFSDTFSWIQGTHAFKAGVEHRRDRTEGWNNNNFTPFAQFGAGYHVAPISSLTVPSLTSNNSTLARNILYDLAGSIDHVRQGFDLRDSTPPLAFEGYQDGVKMKNRDVRANEWSLFVKDDWKVTPNLTLNLGVSWAWFGVPYEELGRSGRATGGFERVCGYSECGLVTIEFAGKNSPQPDKMIFNDDWNDFAPAVGVSWALPGFRRSTILRGGYGIAYTGRRIIQVMASSGPETSSFLLPGMAGVTGGDGLTYRKDEYWSLANLQLPFEPQFGPLEPVPLTDPRALQWTFYAPDRRTPYIQNFTLSIQREVADNLIADVSYVGSKGSKLIGVLPLHAAQIHENSFLEAFNVTRAGGNHPLFDRMLMGLNIPGAGSVNGTTLRGSAALRQYAATRSHLANGNVGELADFLNRSTNVTGKGGGFVRNGGLPEDFFVPYPQFDTVSLNGNASSSTYHSLQMQLTKRLSHGFTTQTSYTWSKALGLADSDNDLFTRDPNNRNLDKARLGYDRSHVITSNGTWALPFGANQALLSGATGWLNHLVGQWQLGGLFRWSSGAPLTITAGGLSNIWREANNTPHVLGALPEGAVTKHTDGSLPSYFEGLTQGTDPGQALVTSTNSLVAAYNRRAIFDDRGNPVLVNPLPGEVGTLGRATFNGPALFQLNMNLQKRIRIDERREFEFRADVTNVLNHPVFNNPSTNINASNFGLISSARDARKVVIGARLNF